MKNLVFLFIFALTLAACGTKPAITDIANGPRRGVFRYASWSGDLKPTNNVFQILVFCDSRYIVNDSGFDIDPTFRYIDFRCGSK